MSGAGEFVVKASNGRTVGIFDAKGLDDFKAGAEMRAMRASAADEEYVVCGWDGGSEVGQPETWRPLVANGIRQEA